MAYGPVPLAGCPASAAMVDDAVALLEQMARPAPKWHQQLPAAPLLVLPALPLRQTRVRPQSRSGSASPGGRATGDGPMAHGPVPLAGCPASDAMVEDAVALLEQMARPAPKWHQQLPAAPLLVLPALPLRQTRVRPQSRSGSASPGGRATGDNVQTAATQVEAPVVSLAAAAAAAVAAFSMLAQLAAAMPGAMPTTPAAMPPAATPTLPTAALPETTVAAPTPRQLGQPLAHSQLAARLLRLRQRQHKFLPLPLPKLQLPPPHLTLAGQAQPSMPNRTPPCVSTLARPPARLLSQVTTCGAVMLSMQPLPPAQMQRLPHQPLHPPPPHVLKRQRSDNAAELAPKVVCVPKNSLIEAESSRNPQTRSKTNICVSPFDPRCDGNSDFIWPSASGS